MGGKELIKQHENTKTNVSYLKLVAAVSDIAKNGTRN